jgi:hypothetical protein
VKTALILALPASLCFSTGMTAEFQGMDVASADEAPSISASTEYKIMSEQETTHVIGKAGALGGGCQHPASPTFQQCFQTQGGMTGTGVEW